MLALESHSEQVQSFIEHRLPSERRLLIAIAGPPGSGKSTLAEAVVSRLNTSQAYSDFAALVPMDGFHLDIADLEPMGLVDRRGAPDTFDLQGLTDLLRTIRNHSGAVRFPLFDRTVEKSIPDAGVLTANARVVVVEGNYLLLDKPGWSALNTLFDGSVFLDVSPETLERRLMARWLSLGFSQAQARRKVHGNDLLNAHLVLDASLPADLVLRGKPTTNKTE